MNTRDDQVLNRVLILYPHNVAFPLRPDYRSVPSAVTRVRHAGESDFEVDYDFVSDRERFHELIYREVLVGLSEQSASL